MNWKLSATLVVLATAAGLWYWKGDAWGPHIGLGQTHAAAESPSLAALTGDLEPGKITRIEVPAASGEPLVLEKTGSNAGWKLPGNWPLREPAVKELVDLLTGLRTRFQPVTLPEGIDLAAYGLADSQKPIVVKVAAAGKDYTLKFGEPKAKPDESPFTRPAYLRINDFPEVLRLGPDVMPVLRRSPDVYRKRQLFPGYDRVKIAATSPTGQSGATTVSLLGDGVQEIAVTAPGQKVRVFGIEVPFHESYTLRRTGAMPKPAAPDKDAEPSVKPDRIADAWEIAAPTRARVDPEKLQKLLAGIPDLWVEEFVASPDKPTKLDQPERTLAITRTNGEKLVLQIGAVAKTVEREVTEMSPPPMPGFPPIPMTKKVTDEYRFARLANNPQVFLLKTDKFGDLFASVKELQDPRLARFATDEVREVLIEVPGRPPVKLLRKKDGDSERWVIDQQPEPVPADSSEITGLLDQLSGLSSSERTDKGIDPAQAMTVTVQAREKRAEGEPEAPVRTYRLLIAMPKPEPAAIAAAVVSSPLAAAAILAKPVEKVSVQLAGWPRVVQVENKAGSLSDRTLAQVLDRPASAYRRKRLFDFSANLDAAAFGPDRPFTVKRENGEWKITQPFSAAADSAEAGTLTNSLDGLTAVEWIDDNPAANLARYGLDKPKRSITLTLTGTGGGEHRLDIGSPREGKSEVYARLDGGAVFTIGATTADQIRDATAFGLLDKTLANLGEIDRLTLERGGKTFTFAKAGGTWKQTAPSDAEVDSAAIDDLAASLKNLRAHSLVAYKPSAEELKKFGLDPPQAKWTVTAGKDRVVLLLGTKDKDGRVPVKTDSGDRVGLLPADVSAKVLADFRPRKIWQLDEAKIDAIEIDRGGKKFKLVRKEAGWEDPAAPKDDIDPVAASVLVTTLGGLQAERWAGESADDLKKAGLEKPSATITVTLSDKTRRVLLLGAAVEGNARQVYARVAEPAKSDAFVLSEADAQRLTRGREEYLRKK